MIYIDSGSREAFSKVAVLNSATRIFGMAHDRSLLTTDAEGYLVDPSEWTEGFAKEVARREGITLVDEHWKVIRFMRGWLE